MAFVEYRNEKCIKVLTYVLLMPLLVDLASVFTRQFIGRDSSSRVTLFIYLISLIVIAIRMLGVSTRREVSNDVLHLLLCYIPFAINYLLFSETRSYIISQDMLIVYLFYFPICIWAIKKISNWNQFFVSMIKPSMMAVLIALFIILFLDYQRYLVYMGFSYALLPFICVLYRTFRTHNENIKIKYLSAMLFVAGELCLLIFGARAVVLFSLAYIPVCEFFFDSSTRSKRISVSLLVLVAFGVLYINIDNVANVLLKFDFLSESRFLLKIQAGQLLQSNTRGFLYESCKDRIANMGLGVSGLFGDRPYCLQWPYPHNIFYELLMSMGWIVGGVAICLLIVLIMRSIFSSNKVNKEICFFLIITMLARYVISGSYLIEGRFWIAVAIMYYMLKVSKYRDIDTDS